MKRILVTICTATFILVACKNETKSDEPIKGEPTVSSNDSKPEKEAWVPVDSATAMKAMMESGTPGEPHKMLAKSTGTWSADVTHWMGEGAPPQKATGTSVTTMLYGGRYQQSKFSGNMMGMPFEGTAIMGYDNTEKKYYSTWIENMSTAIMITWGTWDEASKSITLSGTMKNPANGHECDLKQIYKIVDDNTHVMEMYGPDPKTGKEYKMMEITYTRKK
jgi:uncharacterized lipoprotein NlpE involved in copper resistance